MQEQHHEVRKVIIIIAVLISLTAFGRFLFKPFPYITSLGAQTASVIQSIPNSFTGWLTYKDQTLGFEVHYPPGFTPNEAYHPPMNDFGRRISGISFIVPHSMTVGTNLSQDSYMAVETQTDVACAPSDFIYDAVEGEARILGDNRFISGSASGAGAGNFYEETVYVLRKDTHCYGVRYFIHSTNIANYDAGTVKAFDRKNLLSMFDNIAGTVVLVY